MTKKILWLRPVTTSEYNQPILDVLSANKSPDVEITIKALERGPKHLEYHYYSALVLSDILVEVKRAEQKGFDGIVLACFYDTALREAREIAENIVVAAPGESSMHIAATLGQKFSIIVGDKKWIPKMRENVIHYGFKEQLASFKSIDTGVLSLQKNKGETEKRFFEAAKEAMDKDLAEIIILGCTMDFGFYKTLQERLCIPVIDAILAPLKYTEFLVELKRKFNWATSKAVDYKTPPRNEIKEWDLEKQYSLGKIW